MTTPILNTTNQSPATACPLSGAYLIEASAGTGKTWTLTGILLRLLIEKNVRPERIVATTFTRAAAQEMQERLHGRLDDFYQVCLLAKQHQATFYQPDGAVNQTAFKAFLTAQTNVLPALADPINEQLLGGILAKSVQALDKTLAKIKLLLAMLDKIFIGTLDSLAKKWLKEFAHELGNVAQHEMVTDLDDMTYALVHDELRAIHADVATSNPKLYAIIDKTLLTDVSAMCQSIKNATHFYTADIDTVPEINDTTLAILQERLDGLLAQGFAEFEPYYDGEYRKLQGINGNSAFAKNLVRLTDIGERLTKHGISAFANFDKETVKFLTEHISQENIHGKFFNKNAKGLATWQQLPTQRLLDLQDLYVDCQNINTQFASYVLAKVATNVRQNLVKTLQDNKQTSFSLVMLTLVNGLSGKKGELIARHIRHLYPVALIDEAQDVSGEQMALIERIYLSDTAKQSLFENSDKGFLLLVGDPKQAIYRFRGGDVANYHYMKSLGPDTRFSLLTNRRSSRAVIDGINAWFGADGANDEPNELSLLGDEIVYHQITAVKEQSRLSWQAGANDELVPLVGQTAIGFLHLPYKSELDAKQAVALHINSLLQSGARLDDNGVQRALLPSDFAILLDTNSDALQMQSLLADLGIGAVAVVDNGDSVFVGQACQDLYTLFDAVLSPTDERLGSLLVCLFGYTLAQSEAICQDDKQRGELLLYLKNIQKRWLGQSLLHALSFAFTAPPFVGQSLWTHLAKFDDGERYLADMWQLFEILPTWDLPATQFLEQLQTAMVKGKNAMRVALPLNSSVSVMTMHKSKGLEFTIVYILKMDKDIKSKLDSKHKLYPYVSHHQRRLSASKGLGDNPNYFEQLEHTEALNEKKRLGYVALTRASEQIFVVGQDGFQASTNAMKAWGWLPDGKTYALPTHLADKVAWIELDELWQSGQLITTPYHAQISERTPVPYPEWATVYPNTRFESERTTSFTGLARLFANKFSAHTHSYDETDLPTDTLVHADEGSVSDIRAVFMKGATAGTYLHSVLELASEGQLLSETLKTTADKMGLSFDESSYALLETWLGHVLNLPFLASNVALSSLAIHERINELEFVLSLNHQADLGQLSEMFWEYAGIKLPPLLVESGQLFGYLTGKIDLVYTKDDKYYIVDYKSNFLGNDESCYHEENMQQAMDEHSYWLQATLYQLALHRLLSVKLADYQGQEGAYLGAVEYVFLRGITPDNKALGRLVWQPPLALILALDALFD